MKIYHDNAMISIACTNSSDSFINRNDDHVDNLELTKARDVTM